MIGTKIREIRQSKGMTLNELAESVEVTASYISQLERNLIDPSLSSLRKIANALKVPIYTFLEEEDSEPFYIKADQRKKLELPNSNIIYEFVTPTKTHDSFEPKILTIYFQLEPRCWSSEEDYIHDADESVFIISGELEVHLGNDKYTLKEGDSLYIRSKVPHNFYNPGNSKVIGISTMCPAIYI